MLKHERILHQREGDLEAVQLVHANRAAADRTGLNVHAVAGEVLHVDHGGVRMRLAQFQLVEVHRQTGLVGVLAAVADALVIHGHAEQTGDDRAVRAVAAVGIGKGAVQAHARADGLLFQQAARHQTDARRARRVRTGRTDHDRPDNIKQMHRASPFCLLLLAFYPPA